MSDYSHRMKPFIAQGGVSPVSSSFSSTKRSIQYSTPAKPQPVRKRKFDPAPSTYDEDEENAEAEAQAALAGIEPIRAKKTRRKKGEEPEEKRLRRFRVKPPQSYLERLARVREQRMFLIERSKTLSEDGTHEKEVFDIAGSTGNVYQVTISKVPTCSCPDANKGNHCKHIVYVMVNVLKASENLAYQLAFLSTELAEIFAAAPVTQNPSAGAVVDTKPLSSSLSTNTGGLRKPIEGDCPVCVMEFEEDEEIVWCKAACGQNIHRRCFEEWQHSKSGDVKCVYCRSIWKGDEKDLKSILGAKAEINQEGYVNLAGELGISHERDMSSYHQYWVARQGNGGYGGRRRSRYG